MKDVLIWIVAGPFVYAWQLAGPVVGLIVAGYIRTVFGFRIWRTLLSAFCSSFLYYFVIIPTGGMLGGAMWIIELLMALHTSLFVTLILWLYDKLRRKKDSAGQEEETADV
ncbi:hypothetical protein ACFSO0_00440 [Brevibacillus sp. GCM10020057]|uniref:hypothetical protein n=1 Tax=Brevibacillus sp. GCM10020057 TaxID=3317327 RepID=UPI0036318485